jgi:uncharacterized protein
MAKPMGPVCNMRCKYCYYLETEGLYSKGHAYRMPDSLLERYIQSYIASSPGPIVIFIWHGGEPTLAGIEFYKRAVELQKKYLPEGWQCWNNLQTNGLAIDEAWCEFLAENRFDVGVSIDGSKWLHDLYRLDPNGNGTHKRVLNAIKLLKKYNILPDLLCTVTSDTAKKPLAAYQALNSLHTGWIQFIPIVRHVDGAMTEDSVTGKEYGEFLCTVFNEWACHDIGQLEVQIFAELSRILQGYPASVCQLSEECGRVLVLEHDGQVYACDHFVKAEYSRGDIFERSFSEIVGSEEQTAFGRAKKEISQRCSECRWLHVCHGGCPKDKYEMDGGQSHYWLCDGITSFLDYAADKLKRIALNRLMGKDPYLIMRDMKADIKGT